MPTPRHLLLFLLLLATLPANAQIFQTVAGSCLDGFSGDHGPAIDAKLSQPTRVIWDKDTLFIFDGNNFRIRRIYPAINGTIQTIAGNGSTLVSGDGYSALSAGLGVAVDMCRDKKGNIYITVPGYGLIRKITTDGIIRTIAGTGISGYNGDEQPATSAELTTPWGITVDDTGNIYVSERDGYRIRKIDTSGIIHTFAGTGSQSYSMDGQRADTSKLYHPFLLKYKNGQGLYLIDSIMLRLIDTSGILHTIAGSGNQYYDGEGIPAPMAGMRVEAFDFDTSGHIYIVDGNFRIRKINDEGLINTIAGAGVNSGCELDPITYSEHPLDVKIGECYGLSLAQNGDIFFSEAVKYRINVLSTHLSTTNVVQENEQLLMVNPNPAQGSFVAEWTGSEPKQVTVTLYNATGAAIQTFSLRSHQPQTIAAPWPAGSYYLSTTSPSGIKHTCQLTLK